MAISNLGITPHETGDVTRKKITSSSGTVAFKICFDTQYDSSTAFNIYVTVFAINKAPGENIDSYVYVGEAGDWSDTGAKAASAFTKTGNDDDGYHWELPFSSITGLSDLVGTMSYSGRSYDDLRLVLEVRAFYPEGTGTNSTKAVQTCYIGFRPTLTATSAYWTKQGLWIAYSATGWNRPNDRFELTTSIMLNSGRIVAMSRYWATVKGFGKILIPADKILNVPINGEKINTTIRFAGSWQVEGTTLAVLTVRNLSVEDRTQLKTPTLAVQLHGDGVLATVGQTGSGSDLESVVVQLAGSPYGIDRYEIALDANHRGSHVFMAPPYKTETKWLATGYADVEGETEASNTVSAICSALPDYSGAAFTSIEDGETIRVPYSVIPRSSTRPDSVSVMLDGHERQTTGYGTGGYVNWSITGKAVAEGFGRSYGTTMESTDIEALRNIPLKGDCIVRLHGGVRFQAKLKVDVSNPEKGMDRCTVSVQCEETA